MREDGEQTNERTNEKELRTRERGQREMDADKQNTHEICLCKNAETKQTDHEDNKTLNPLCKPKEMTKYLSNSLVLVHSWVPLLMTIKKSCVRTKGTRSRLYPNFFFL